MATEKVLNTQAPKARNDDHGYTVTPTLKI